MRLNARSAIFLLLPMMAGCWGGSASQSSASVSESERTIADARRGRLLYDTACGACHDEQVHWRGQRLVRDWPSLVYQVTRWQRNSGQTWRADEIEDVAAYLNRRFYHLPCPIPGCAAEARIGLGRAHGSTDVK